MGIFSIFSKKTSAEEREERSRKEQELAQRYYDKGYRLGERLGLHRIVERTNTFINRYPVTSFAVFAVAVIAMFVFNTVMVKVDFSGKTERDMRNTASAAVTIEKDSLQTVMEGLLDEYTTLQGQLEDIMGRDDLTKEDSLRAITIYKRLLQLEDVFTGNEQAGIEVMTNPAEEEPDEEP